jgi:hypothetical protein
MKTSHSLNNLALLRTHFRNVPGEGADGCKVMGALGDIFIRNGPGLDLILEPVQGLHYYDVKGKSRFYTMKEKEMFDLLDLCAHHAPEDSAINYLYVEYQDKLRKDKIYNNAITGSKVYKKKWMRVIGRFGNWLDYLNTSTDYATREMVSKLCDILHPHILADIDILKEWRANFPLQIEVFNTATIGGITFECDWNAPHYEMPSYKEIFKRKSYPFPFGNEKFEFDGESQDQMYRFHFFFRFSFTSQVTCYLQVLQISIH